MRGAASVLAVYGGTLSGSLEARVTQDRKYSPHFALCLSSHLSAPSLHSSHPHFHPERSPFTRPPLSWLSLDTLPRSPPFLYTLPPPVACTATNVPKLHAPAGQPHSCRYHPRRTTGTHPFLYSSLMLVTMSCGLAAFSCQLACTQPAPQCPSTFHPVRS